jgi:hypothetical protein
MQDEPDINKVFQIEICSGIFQGKMVRYDHDHTGENGASGNSLPFDGGELGWGWHKTQDIAES